MVFCFSCAIGSFVGQRACARQTALASELAYNYGQNNARGQLAARSFPAVPLTKSQTSVLAGAGGGRRRRERAA